MLKRRREPLKRQFRPVLIIFLGITIASLGVTFVSIAVESAVRGFVEGESRWSKSQRDAVYMLDLYARSRDEGYYARFQAALAIPLAFSAARDEADKPNGDLDRIRLHLLQAGIHPDDVDGMIHLYRCCSNLLSIRQAVQAWRQGDRQVSLLENIGTALHDRAGSPAEFEAMLPEILRQVEAIHLTNIPLTDEFSSALGDVARATTRFLFVLTGTVIFVLLLLGSYLVVRILRRVRMSESQYRLLMDSASDALVVLSRDDGRVLTMNQRAEQLLGASHAARRDLRFETLFVRTDPGPCVIDAAAMRSRGDSQRLLGRFGNTPVEVNQSDAEWEGEPARLAIIRDIRERIEAEQRLLLATNALAAIAEGVFITNRSGVIVSINHAFTAITGYEPEEVMNRRIDRAPSHRPIRAQLPAILSHLLTRGSWQGELPCTRKSGQPYPQALSVSRVLDEESRVTHYVGVFHDNSASKQYENRLRHLAGHDSLTQLANRATFEEHCREALGDARALDGSLALLFIDLDGFKAVNDSYGHQHGDRLLQQIAQRIRSCMRDTDLVARVGGDEFTILLRDLSIEGSDVRVARKLLERIAEPVLLEGRSLRVSASIGISRYPEHAHDWQTLLSYADMAMYEAKHSGRNSYRVFDPTLASKSRMRLQLANGLRAAIDGLEFELHYQPCVDLSTQSVVGFEALLRWQHPELGSVSPTVFIPIAEELGIIDPITDWVIRAACEQGAAWAAQGLPTLPIAVNVSRHCFWDPALPDRIARILHATGWQANLLRIEITETTMSLREDAAVILERLSAMGLRLAIDDFGVGYSSLSSLRSLPVDTLKIDRSFIRDLPSSNESMAVVNTIVALAKSLSLTVTAEGIETADQLDVLRQAGCEQGQGFLFGHPSDALRASLLLTATSPAPTSIQ
ncbi:MAG: EAL domain-containing protein [Burkholderiaceae bacterium]